MPKILVIYFSRTGHTKKVAQKLAAVLDADVERVEDVGRNRGGFFGYMYSGYQGAQRKLAPIRPLANDPAAYDVVIAGTPIWAGNMSAPMRALLTGVAGKVRAAAFFCTMGGSGGKRAFKEMGELLDLEPLATLEVTESELKDLAWSEKVDVFARRLTAAIK